MSHKPQRFQVYTQLSDGSGFKIPGSDHIFLFDRKGGWFDEENNYYNANGEPQTPPSSSRSSSSSDRNNQYTDEEEYDDFYEDIVNQYKYDHHSDDEDPSYNAEELRNMEKIETNLEILSDYPLQKALRVYYRNMDYFKKAEDIKKLYQQQHVKITSVVPTIGDDGRTKSQGYFVMPDRQQAKILVQLEGKNIIGRPVYFKVEQIQELIVDPIDKQWTSGQKQIWRQNTCMEKPKGVVEQKQQRKVEQKVQSEEQCKKVQLGVEQQQSFVYCSFDLNLFEDSKEFKQWMKNFGLEWNKHFKTLKKRENTQTQTSFGTLLITERALLKCNNKPFKDTLMKFQIMQD